MKRIERIYRECQNIIGRFAWILRDWTKYTSAPLSNRIQGQRPERCCGVKRGQRIRSWGGDGERRCSVLCVICCWWINGGWLTPSGAVKQQSARRRGMGTFGKNLRLCSLCSGFSPREYWSNTPTLCDNRQHRKVLNTNCHAWFVTWQRIHINWPTKLCNLRVGHK